MRGASFIKPACIPHGPATWPAVDFDDTHAADNLDDEDKFQYRLQALETARQNDAKRLSALEMRLKEQEVVVQQFLQCDIPARDVSSSTVSGRMPTQSVEDGLFAHDSGDSIMPAESVEPKNGEARRPARGSVHYRRASEIVHGDRSYTVAESIWDVLILAWSPSVGWGSSLLITVAAIVNACMQVLCSIIAITALAPSGNFTVDSVVDDAQRWRVSEAHSVDRMDKANWVSLASRVCNMDGTLIFGNMQASRLKEIGAYVGELPGVGSLGVGGTLAIVCLAIFGLFLANELSNCILFIEALLAVPRTFKKTSIEWDGDALRLHSISIWRVGFMLGMAVIRICIAMTLLYAGGKWLSNTSVLGDLLLNCAALVFVLELDELLYKSLVPGLVKGLVGRLKPVRLPSERMLRGLSLRPLLVLLACIFYVAWMTIWIVQPMYHRMVEVEKAMCKGGTTEFVVDVSPFLGIALVAATRKEPAGKSLNNTYTKRVTRDFACPTESPYRHDFSTSQKLVKFAASSFSDSKGLFSGKYRTSAVTVQSELELQKYMKYEDFPEPGCEDVFDMYGTLTDGYMLALQYATGKFSATKCTDFAALCKDDSFKGNMVRLYCSSTCGCQTNSFTPIVRTGCRPDCSARLQLEQVYRANQSERFADCIDYYDPLFFNGTLGDVYFQDFERHMFLPRGAVPRELFRQLGCATLELSSGVSRDEDWKHQKGRLVDMLCGRVRNSNLAIKDPSFVSLRTRCPVACGCTVDLGGGCPSSCERGPGATAVDVCSFGVCKAGAELNATRESGAMTCGAIDAAIRSSGQGQQCELLQANHRSTCCTPET